MVASNTCWSLINQGGRAVALAIVLVALSRHLGPSDFGLFIFAFSITRLLALGAAFGLDRVMIHELSTAPLTGPALLRSAFLLKLGTGSLAYVISIALAIALRPGNQAILLLVSIMGISLLLQAFDVWDFKLQSQQRMDLVALGRTVPLVAGTLLKLIAVFLHAPLAVFAWCEVAEAALIALSLFIVARHTSRRGISETSLATFQTIGTLMKRGFPFLLSGLALSVYMRSDILMLGAMGGSRATGIYAVATQVTELWNIIPVAVSASAFPYLLSLRRSDPALHRSTLAAFNRYMATAGLVIAATVTIFAAPIVLLLFGADYEGSAGVLRIYVWSAVFVFLSSMQGIWEYGEGMMWWGCIRNSVGALCNIALNFLLIPKFGPTGAAIATLISYGAAVFLVNAVNPKTRCMVGLHLRSLLIYPALIEGYQALSHRRRS